MLFQFSNNPTWIKHAASWNLTLIKFHFKKLLNLAPCVSRSRKKKYRNPGTPNVLMGKTKVSWVSCRCFLPKNLTMESDHGTWPSPPPPRLRLTSAAAYAAQQLPRQKNLPTTCEIIKSMQIHPYNLHLEPKKTYDVCIRLDISLSVHMLMTNFVVVIVIFMHLRAVWNRSDMWTLDLTQQNARMLPF